MFADSLIHYEVFSFNDLFSPTQFLNIIYDDDSYFLISVEVMEIDIRVRFDFSVNWILLKLPHNYQSIHDSDCWMVGEYCFRIRISNDESNSKYVETMTTAVRIRFVVYSRHYITCVGLLHQVDDMWGLHLRYVTSMYCLTSSNWCPRDRVELISHVSTSRRDVTTPGKKKS